jgi:histidinol-phosphatase (PHP family)
MSGDAEGELTEYLKTAQARGLTEIGFSDHFHVKKQDYSMSRTKLAEYVRKVEAFKKTVDFPIKLGLEIDFISGLENEIVDVLRIANFDYVIGSVHFIDGWGFDDPKYIAEYQKWDVNKLYCAYFGLVQQCAKSRLFNIIGHADLIKKFNYRPKGDITEIYLETVEAFKKSNVCVEVNTRGLMVPCNEIYPSKVFLKMCFEAGIPITLGSDAHSPKEVGNGFSQAVKLIREVGYEKIARFSKCKMELVSV